MGQVADKLANHSPGVHGGGRLQGHHHHAAPQGGVAGVGEGRHLGVGVMESELL